MGVYLTTDLRWTENTSNICSKVNRKLYIINKLKHFGLEKEELITAWKSILRPITEYAVPLWHSGLSENDSDRIEMLQKRVLAVILGLDYINFKKYYKVNDGLVSYEDALELLGLTTLKHRREVLTTKFALDTARSQLHNDLFVKNDNQYMATRNRLLLIEPNCQTDRYYNSAVPYMIRILNNVFLSKQK